MAYQHKNNRGSLFKNSKKDKENSPDYKGSGVVNDQEVWISGWLEKNDAKAITYLSLSFTPKVAGSTVQGQLDSEEPSF